MNRKWFQLWNIGRLRGRLMDILSLGRTMLLLAGGSLVLFMLLGAGGLAGQKLNSSPIPSMKGLAASLSSGFFMELLGMEVPHLPKGEEPSAFSGDKVTSFVFRLLTSVDPGDPKSLVSREMPGLAADDPFLLRQGSGEVQEHRPTIIRGAMNWPPEKIPEQGAILEPCQILGKVLRLVMAMTVRGRHGRARGFACP